MKKAALLLGMLLMVTGSTFAQKKDNPKAHAQQAKHLTAATTPHSVVLSWGAATVPTGAPPVTSYNVYRGTTAGGEGSTPFAQPGNVLTFTDSTVTAGGTFCYVVTAVNSSGEGPKSNEFCGSIPNPAPPNAPTGLTGVVN